MQHQHLGQLLLDRQIISSQQLKNALIQQQGFTHSLKPKLGQLLLQNRWVSEEDLLKALAFQRGLGFIRLEKLEEDDLDSQFLQLIPLEESEHFQVVPLRQLERGKQRFFVVATANPDQLDYFQELEFRVGCRVETLIATSRGIQNFQERFYGKARTDLALKDLEIDPAFDAEFYELFGRVLDVSDFKIKPTDRQDRQTHTFRKK